MANDRLSRACSAIIRYNNNVEAGAEDIMAFNAPSECLSLVIEGAEKQLEQEIHNLGYLAVEQVRQLAEKRVGYKFVYLYL